MKKLLLVVVALAFPVLALAQQYKWVDKDGRVQYGDAPPPGVKATRIKGSSAAPAPAAPAEAGKDAASKDKPLSPEAAFKKRQQEREEADKKASQEAAQAETRRQNCERAQANLRQLESGQRISSVNAAGERVYLDDDQRAKNIQAAQKSVSDWCR
jgi:hypothetical protein